MCALGHLLHRLENQFEEFGISRHQIQNFNCKIAMHEFDVMVHIVVMLEFSAHFTGSP